MTSSPGPLLEGLNPEWTGALADNRMRGLILSLQRHSFLRIFRTITALMWRENDWVEYMTD